MRSAMQLVWPSPGHLDGYTAALQRGWSPDSIRGEVAAHRELARIAADPAVFSPGSWIARPRAHPSLPDGSPRPAPCPGIDAGCGTAKCAGASAFAGSPGSAALRPIAWGHIGYAVVPWKRGRGYATLALGQLLPENRALRFAVRQLTTDPITLASQRVIVANGGVLIERFYAARSGRLGNYGFGIALSWQIQLPASTSGARDPGSRWMDKARKVEALEAHSRSSRCRTIWPSSSADAALW